MARDTRPSEYGGRPGTVQRASDGHAPTPRERAREMRMAGIRDGRARQVEDGRGSYREPGER